MGGGGGVGAGGLAVIHTLCRLAVGRFSFVQGHAGPRLGLHVSIVHILENTGKPQTFFTLDKETEPNPVTPSNQL